MVVGWHAQFKQSFQATTDTPVTVSLIVLPKLARVQLHEAPSGFFNETETSYVLFADVRGEGGWRYNRKIGEDGDVPTGGGNISAFDGDAFDDGGLHTMSIVANGSTVKLLLDGIEGAEVFPFENVHYHLAHLLGQMTTPDTTWDNLKVETVLGLSVVFEDDFSSNEIDPARYGESTRFLKVAQEIFMLKRATESCAL